MNIDPDMLKRAFKEALLETLNERRDLLYNLLVEAMEDVALRAAIEAGRRSELTTPDEVFGILKN